MAGTRARRVGRALRMVVVLTLAAGALGVGTSSVLHAVDAGSSRRLDSPNQALLDAAASFPSQLDTQTFHLVPPGGRGPVVVQRPAATPAAPTATATATPARPSSTTAAASRTPAPPAAGPAPGPAGRATLPLGVNAGASTEVITVAASSSSATTAQLTAWQRGPGGWTAVVGPVTARIGKDGVGRASETTSRTPAGTFGLTEAFGRSANPGTALPYRRINTNDYWISDVGSSRYNQFYECAPGTCPFITAAGEHLWDAGSSYNYAVVIDYNRWPAVPGAGSAFFLHVTNGAPTAGCVAIDQGSLVRIMQWLDPAAKPLIAIGVG